MSQNEIKNSTVPIAENEISLFDKLIQFGKDCDNGNYPDEPFEIQIHRARVAGTQDYLDFVEKILAFLIEKQYLVDTQETIQGALDLLMKHDSWNDMHQLADASQTAIAAFEKVVPTSILGEERQREILRILRFETQETEKALDFKIPMPLGVSYGNAAFHQLVHTIAKAAFEKSQVFMELTH